jgi:hypothetical protein
MSTILQLSSNTGIIPGSTSGGTPPPSTVSPTKTPGDTFVGLPAPVTAAFQAELTPAYEVHTRIINRTLANLRGGGAPGSPAALELQAQLAASTAVITLLQRTLGVPNPNTVQLPPSP